MRHSPAESCCYAIERMNRMIPVPAQGTSMGSQHSTVTRGAPHRVPHERVSSGTIPVHPQLPASSSRSLVRLLSILVEIVRSAQAAERSQS
jgi:hypothetical protein